MGVFGVRQELQQQVEQVQKKNRVLKMEYDALLERQRGAETRLREAEDKGGHLLEDMIHLKQQAADRMNSLNERKSRYLNTPEHRGRSSSHDVNVSFLFLSELER